jgi:DNA-binding MarR family transcriptional regulator
MEKAKLVRRVPDPDDGRAFLVEPLEHKQRKKIERTVTETEHATFAKLSEKERKTLYALLEKI